MPTILGKELEVSKNWVITHFLNFGGLPQNCHGAGECHLACDNVLQKAYNKVQSPLGIFHHLGSS